MLVIGEMRDHESMRIALSAAETGHLVFSSLHTTDIASTIAPHLRLVSQRAAEHDPAGAVAGARRR